MRKCKYDLPDWHGFGKGILKYELEIIENIQYRYKILTPQLEFFSIVSHPRMAHFVAFPLGYNIAPGIGLSVLWVGIISNICTYIFKSFLQENRPYWWVKKNYDLVPNVTLVQYPLTCSVLPGSPCAHSVITAAVWWTVLTILTQWLTSCERKAFTFLFWILMILVGISRSFLASNFPHQSLFGVLTGIGITSVVKSYKLYNAAPIQYFHMSIVVLIIAGLYSYVLPKIGLSEAWTYCYANHYCNDATWISSRNIHNMDPFIENIGMLLGSCVALLTTTILSSSRRVEIKPDKGRRLGSAILSMLIISVIRCLMSQDLQTDENISTYNIIVFIQFFFIPLIVILFVPRFFKLYKSYT